MKDWRERGDHKLGVIFFRGVTCHMRHIMWLTCPRSWAAIFVLSFWIGMHHSGWLGRSTASWNSFGFWGARFRARLRWSSRRECRFQWSDAAWPWFDSAKSPPLCAGAVGSPSSSGRGLRVYNGWHNWTRPPGCSWCCARSRPKQPKL